MDNPAHDCPVPSLNTRKRKADSQDEDIIDPSDDSLLGTTTITMLVDPPAIIPRPPSTPRQTSTTPWLDPGPRSQVWSPPSSSAPVAAPPKRKRALADELSEQVQPEATIAMPQLPRLQDSLTSKRSRVDGPSHRSKHSCRRCRRRHDVATAAALALVGSRRRSRTHDMIDMGIVPTTSPGSPHGSLLRTSSRACDVDLSLQSSMPPFTIDRHSPHIPAVQPLINRQTLKELDLDAILRNPQLRHDLLFDAALQFRPVTSRRRKRESCENYWTAIVRELETGCTCVSFDLHGKPHALLCACQQVPLPAHTPMLAFSSSHGVLTLRMPSRIKALLYEFLEVLLSVIQPLASISGMYVNPNTFASQMRVHASQAAYLRSVFDPELIEQELKYGVFDPSGLFRLIGDTLKSHCAPMRDSAVDSMVEVAESYSSGRAGSNAEAVKVIRICLDILELMKLDVANHQLQTLRPFLTRTSGQFEFKTFIARQGPGATFELTRTWLQAAHRDMLVPGQSLPHPLYSSPLVYSTLQRNQQIYVTVLRALTDLVFSPPSLPADADAAPISPISPSSPSSPSTTQYPVTISPSLPGYPETAYLDNARLSALSVDAADTIALYMYLLLYRQLIFADPKQTRHPTKVDEADLLKLKNEIRDIGTTRLGYCFTQNGTRAIGQRNSCEGTETEGWKKWCKAKQDVILQVSMRAREVQNRSTPTASSSSPVSASPLRNAPDEDMLKLAERWSDTHFQSSSALGVMLRQRLRDAVFRAVVAIAFPGRDASTGKSSAVDCGSLALAASKTDLALGGAATGMEPLADEIRSLAERVSRLALIHLNAYLPLYEQEGFLDLSKTTA